MQFLRDNGSMVSRLVITHIAMSIFGLVLFGATNQQDATLMLAASIFSVIFYAVIVYTTMWEYGAKDKPAFDAERKKGAWKCGFLVSMIAEGFWFLLSILSMFEVFAESVKPFSRVCYVILILTHSCFTGIETFIRNSFEISKDARFWLAFLYIAGSVLISLAAATGYLFGTKELRIIPKKNTAKK